MKVIIAIDSFKGSMSSLQAGEAAKTGVLQGCNNADCIVLPIADGGEGTTDSLVQGLNGDKIKITVSGPLLKSVDAEYGVIKNTAVIEMATAAGINLLSKYELNPMETTTYGVGEIIKDAIKNGIRDFIIGIGGSATNDGGVGMLQALGYEFLDKNGQQIKTGAKGLGDLVCINDDNVLPELKECTFNIACDVKNPLCGENGCSNVFAPQKGASLKDIEIMDINLFKYAELTAKKFGRIDIDSPGTGAAGGLGFAFKSYLNGNLKPGIDLILSAIDAEQHIKDADLVITGEGRIDKQTTMGKVPVGVARIAKKYNIPVLAFAGVVSDDASLCNNYGIDAIFPILRKVCSLEEAMKREIAQKNMSDTVEQAMRLFKISTQEQKVKVR